jgi:hypothetical protein
MSMGPALALLLVLAHAAIAADALTEARAQIAELERTEERLLRLAQPGDGAAEAKPVDAVLLDEIDADWSRGLRLGFDRIFAAVLDHRRRSPGSALDHLRTLRHANEVFQAHRDRMHPDAMHAIVRALGRALPDDATAAAIDRPALDRFRLELAFSILAAMHDQRLDPIDQGLPVIPTLILSGDESGEDADRTALAFLHDEAAFDHANATFAAERLRDQTTSAVAVLVRTTIRERTLAAEEVGVRIRAAGLPDAVARRLDAAAAAAP